jgi:cytochrome P450
MQRSVAGALSGFERITAGATYNPLDPQLSSDPYPLYRRLRERDPVHRSYLLRGFVLTRHEDVLGVLKDARFSADEKNSPGFEKQMRRMRKLGLLEPDKEIPISMLRSDPPDHTRLRQLVSKAFTPRAITAIEPRIEAIVNERLDRAAEHGGMELISGLASPVPVIVIAEMIGVPVEDRDRFTRWSDDVVRGMGVQSIRDARISVRASRELEHYFKGIAAVRREDPKDDLMSRLLEAEEEGDRLTTPEVMSILQLLLVAGNETTTNLIGNGLLALMRNPDQLELLQRNPDLVEGAIDELLRYDGPVQATSRIALEDVEIGGRTVRKGQNAFVVLGAANRDPERFADPDRLDVTRNPEEHVSFGHGRHFCLGSNLARLEARYAIRGVIERFPNLKLATDEIVWRKNIILHGITSLPVRF